MRNKKFDKNLLTEEIKRFQSLNEFEFNDFEKDNTDLLLSNNKLGEAEDEEAPADEEGDGFEDVEATDTDGGGDGEGFGSEELPSDGEDAEAGFGDDAEGDGFGDEPAADAEGDGFGDEPAIEDPMDDAVELDVTELVKGSEEAKASADAANQKIGQLIGMVDKLEGQLNGMNQISSKIDNLEKEIEKRNPTEDEKIEMRSLDSYPYNLKLTDFWSDQKGQYDVMNQEDKAEEYELDRKGIDSDYVETDVKDSFDANIFDEDDV